MTAAAELARTIAVVGAGPRGTAIIERLVAASNGPQWRGGLTVHLIDPLVGRGGAVWRHDQSAVLLMNTTTCQTTMYPDESCHAMLPAPRTRTSRRAARTARWSRTTAGTPCGSPPRP